MDWSARPALTIRAQTSLEELPETLGEAFSDIMSYLGELGESPTGAPFVAYYNFDLASMDIVIGFPVAHTLPGRGNIQASELPSGKVASCLYTGPYDKVAPAYEALTQWIEEMGYTATGVAYEIYLNEPSDTPPEKLKTQIAFPLLAMEAEVVVT
jgi:effector-binding domain-containing protein